MKFLVVCLLLLTCIVALSIGQSEGFFNAPPTRIAVTSCLLGDLVVLNGKTTDETTLAKVYIVYHSTKNSLEEGDVADQILVSDATVTKTDSTIHTIPSSSMVVGKKYYVIQVAAATETNADAKKYKMPAATPATPAATLLNTLMGVYTHSAPSPCATRIAVSACLKGDLMVLNAKTMDNTTMSKIYVVYHSSKNYLNVGESTDQILVTNATVNKTDSSIRTFRPSNMVVGKRYYVIQVTASTTTDPETTKYKIPAANTTGTPSTSLNNLVGIYTYSLPSLCPSQYERNVDAYRRSRSNDDDDSSSRSRPSYGSQSTRTSRSDADGDTRSSRYRSDATPTAAHWRTFERQDPSGAAISGTSDQAQSLKQRMDILSDIQSLMKKKTLESRRLPQYDTDSKSKNAPSASLCQGREYKKACDQDTNTCNQDVKNTCDHDMTQYIRKDSIPCWKCNLDY